MFGFALREWFVDWPDATLFYDDRWPRSLLGTLVAAGAAGVAVLVWAGSGAPELLAAATHPAALALAFAFGVLLAKWWFSDDARHLPLGVLAHWTAANGAAVLAAVAGAVPREQAAAWITCACVAMSLATPALGRAWTLLVFYARLHREAHDNAARALALVADEVDNGGDVLVSIRGVNDETVELAVLDARGEHPGQAARTLLPRIHRGLFVLEGATLIEEPIAAEGSYRETTRGLRVTSLAAAKYIGHGRPGDVTSWTTSIVVASGMLVVHQLVVSSAAWWLSRAANAG